MKVVYLRWHDSCSHHGWGKETSVLSIVDSIGLLVCESRESITIATSFDTTSGLWSDRMVIPRVAIIERKVFAGLVK